MYPFLKHIKNSDHGFSLLEIMVALFLIAMITLAIPMGQTNNRKVLETAIDDVDRAIRFAGNEAILRNTVTRVSIYMEKNPVEFTVEASTSDDILLPNYKKKTVESLEEAQEIETKMKKLDKQFSKVGEFERIKRELHENVIIIGMYTGYQEAMVKNGIANIYFYPSGERDSAMVLFNTPEEVASLEVMPFQNKTKVKYRLIDEDVTDSDAEVENIIRELHSEWLTE
jgi:prepilin-type N-terminal cleavage/methylation domain-containing protein